MTDGTTTRGGKRFRFRRERRRHRKASLTLLLLYISIQRTRARAVVRNGVLAPDEMVVKRCDDLAATLREADFAQNPVWIDVYEIERELLLVQTGTALLQSLKMLLDRADAVRMPAAADLRRTFEALLGTERAAVSSVPPPPPPPPGPPTVSHPSLPADTLLLPLALTVLENLQWNQTKRFEAAPLKRIVVQRLVASGLVAFGFFVLPYVWSAAEAVVQHQIHMRDWSWLPLWTALTAGLLGAFFSRLLTVQKGFAALTINDIENIGDWDKILLRGAVGMLGSLALLVFLQSQVVTGSLFPDFQAIGWTGRAKGPFMTALPNHQLALLVVWSFIAGFSERLVPRILSKTESQLTEAALAASVGTKP